MIIECLLARVAWVTLKGIYQAAQRRGTSLRICLRVRWTPALLTEILTKTRTDSSLGILSKRFVELLRKAPDGTIDLNYAVEQMAVQKRRIYDIVNILEGVGLVEKTGRNGVKWRERDSMECDDGEEARLTSLQTELTHMDERERELDELMEQARSDLKAMTTDPDKARYAYVTKTDLEAIESLEDQTIISIQAPPGTRMQIPQPEEQVQMWLKTSRSPIQVTWTRPNTDSSVRMINARNITVDQQDNKDFDLVEEMFRNSMEQTQNINNNEQMINYHGVTNQVTRLDTLDAGHTDMNNQESITALQNRQSFEQLIADLVHLQGLPGNQNRPIKTFHNNVNRSTTNDGVTFDDVARNMWHSVQAPAYPNNPVPVPVEDPLYDVSGFINSTRQELESADDVNGPLSPLMADDVYYLALREAEGLAELF
ncbi:uncharacterized protein LOC5511431 isoform X2 [Nematostella vectensis]|uniref:uncharacterized protein LOC5511431 isoform X2 n=1 Tax=Nematostella vectensis TaxID=45351 RepID=UPI0013901D08|nr:uncharacterized protein LOC5511431 isoform X2 [Nematostella vectensis]